MYAKFMFVGLGGAGGRTLARLQGEIRDWLKENDLPETIPEGWQFLHIDTPVICDAEPAVAENEYLNLVEWGTDYQSVLATLNSDPELHDELQNWQVSPVGLNVDITTGAGQYRAVGSTIAFSSASRIREKLKDVSEALQRDTTDSELNELYQKTTREKAAGGACPCYCLVVSSLAGGTGAGLLLTVCDLIRGTWGEDNDDKIFGVLYTPEAFDGLRAAAINGVQPNSLAAISELLNGYWWNGAPDIGRTIEAKVAAKRSKKYTRAGMVSALPTSGPRYPFLIGKVNTAGVSHGDADDLYAAVARAMLSWVTDTIVQKDFISHTVSNWQLAAEGHTMARNFLFDSGDRAEKGWPAISGLGFARLSIGTRYLEKYSALRLTRDALENIALFHKNSEPARAKRQELKTDDVDRIAAGLAEDYYQSFLHQCDLLERDGDDNDQIIDALRPRNVKAYREKFAKTVQQHTGIGLGVEKKKRQSRTPNAWIAEIEGGIRNSKKEFNEAYTTDLNAKTKAWIPATETKILEELERTISQMGLKVAAAVCNLAATELEEIANKELDTEQTDYSDWSEGWKRVAHAKASMDDFRGKNIDSENEGLKKYLKEAVKASALSGEAMVRSQAKELSLELAKRVLRPLAVELEEALKKAVKGLVEADEWPEWEALSVSTKLRPPKSEFTLVKTGEWAKTFNRLLLKEFRNRTEEEGGGEDLLPEEARQSVRDEIISGSFLRKEVRTGQRTGDESRRYYLLSPTKSWWPDHVSVGHGGKIASTIAVTINSDKDALKERSLLWLNRSDSRFGRYLATSLRAYLSPTGLFDDDMVVAGEYEERKVRFEAQLRAAIRAADPLIKINRKLYPMVHQPAQPVVHHRSISKIPVGGLDKLEKDTKVVLEANGLTDDAVSKLLTSDSRIRHIDITTTLGAPYSPLVIDSLFHPIAETWVQHKNAGNVRTFWSYRRAAPLAEFIPAPQALINCMVRGWFVGYLLGQIDRGRKSNDRVRIARKDDVPATFPHPFLSQGGGMKDQLALVLENLAIAFVQCDETDSVEPLSAYGALRDLGSSKPGESDWSVSDYSFLHPALCDWVESGTLSRDKKVTISNVAPPLRIDQGGPVARADAIVEYLEKVETSYKDGLEKLRIQYVQDPNSLSGHPVWPGLWPQIEAQIGLIKTALRQTANAAESEEVDV